MTRILWKLFKRQFLKLYAKEQSNPITHIGLLKCFVDMDGRQYYKFPSGMALPIERFGKLQEFMNWMSVALTGSELEKLLDEADKALMDGLHHNKGAAKIGAIIHQIRERKFMAIPTELLYNYVTVQVIREDEPVECFNEKIHLEKIEQFKREVAAGNSYDFFTKLGLQTLTNWFSMSKEEWDKYWHESEAMTMGIAESLKIYSSGIPSLEKQGK